MKKISLGRAAMHAAAAAAAAATYDIMACVTHRGRVIQP